MTRKCYDPDNYELRPSTNVIWPCACCVFDDRADGECLVNEDPRFRCASRDECGTWTFEIFVVKNAKAE